MFASFPNDPPDDPSQPLPHPRPPKLPLARSPSLSYRLLVSSCTLLAVLLPFALSYFSLAQLDVCVVDRYPSRLQPSALSPLSSLDPLYNDTAYDTRLDPASASEESLSESLLGALNNEPASARNVQPTTIMLACLIACCLIKAFLPSVSHPHLSSLRFLALLKVLLAYMWYLGFYFLCNALKGYMGDATCNVHANSISGHYLFHLYSGLALLHIHAQQTHATHYSVLSAAFHQRLFASNVSKLFMFVWVCYALLSAIILMNTYLHGYHSLRQILYGAALALCQPLADDGGAGDAGRHAHPPLRPARIGHAHAQRAPYTPTLTSSRHSCASARCTCPQDTLPPLSALLLLLLLLFLLLSPRRPPPPSLELSPSPSQLGGALTAAHAPMAPRYVSGFSPFQRLLWYGVQYSLRVSDERGLFFVFPFVLTMSVQVVAFVALLFSPANDMWRGLDVAAVGLSWVVLAYLYAFHLRLPVGARRESPALLQSFSTA